MRLFSSTTQTHHLAFPTLSAVLDDVFEYPLSNIGSANRIAELRALFSARSNLVQANTVIDAVATKQKCRSDADDVPEESLTFIRLRDFFLVQGFHISFVGVR